MTQALDLDHLLNDGLPGGLRIHAASQGDIPLIQRLAHSIWTTYYPGILSRSQIAYMLGRMYAEHALATEMAEAGCTFEVVSHREPIGFLCYRRQASRAVWLNKLYLDTAWHGRGIGGALLRRIDGIAEAHHLPVIELRVNTLNRSAINAYHRHGFEIAGSVVTPLEHGFVLDDYRMIKKLRPGAH
jgi:GNAT superfamily N-acetyltransferase